MDIDKFIKNKGLKIDCIVESDLDVEEYVQYEVRDLIKEAVNEQLRLYIVSGSLPFDEYHKFHKWMEDEGWYQASEMEYDNHNDPNSCVRLDIKELYIEYKRRQ